MNIKTVSTNYQKKAMNNQTLPIPVAQSNEYKNTDGLYFANVKLDPAYAKKWNEHSTDFIMLTYNGELISETLYRVGGLNSPTWYKNKYIMLLKYEEAFYSKEILKMSKSTDGRHLEGNWCILDNKGVEKVKGLHSLDHAYLIKNSCLYTIQNKIINIETGEVYVDSYYGSRLDSTEFVFVENRYDEDKSKRGVLKINKLDGSKELIK